MDSKTVSYVAVTPFLNQRPSMTLAEANRILGPERRLIPLWCTDEAEAVKRAGKQIEWRTG